MNLTEREHEALTKALHFFTERADAFGGYECACGSSWLADGCAKGGVEEQWEQRDAVVAAVERIVAARLVDAEALADLWERDASISGEECPDGKCGACTMGNLSQLLRSALVSGRGLGGGTRMSAVWHAAACWLRARWRRRRSGQPFWREDRVAQALG